MDKIDVRGLSCPQPVVETMNKMKKIGNGTFQVLADTATSKENIYRMALSKGWKVKTTEEGDEFILTISS